MLEKMEVLEGLREEGDTRVGGMKMLKLEGLEV